MWDQLDAERKEVYKKKTEAAKKVFTQMQSQSRVVGFWRPHALAGAASSVRGSGRARARALLPLLLPSRDRIKLPKD